MGQTEAGLARSRGAHLSRVYAKLGIRSRAQLARRFGTPA